MPTLKFVSPLFVVIAICLMQSGCSTLQPLSNSAPPVAGQAVAGMYMVNVFPAFGGKETSFKGQIRGNMTVQNALEESGAMKMARKADIELFRVVQGSGRTLKMPVEFQKGTSLVKFEQDYALHPGDRLVIRGKAGSGMGKVLDSILSSASK